MLPVDDKESQFKKMIFDPTQSEFAVPMYSSILST